MTVDKTQNNSNNEKCVFKTQAINARHMNILSEGNLDCFLNVFGDKWINTVFLAWI